jgi:hypothetical protein
MSSDKPTPLEILKLFVEAGADKDYLTIVLESYIKEFGPISNQEEAAWGIAIKEAK